MKIAQALALLDPGNDDHWTDDGLARVEALATVGGRQFSREEITGAAPDFNREAAQAQAEAALGLDEPSAEPPAAESPPEPPPAQVEAPAPEPVTSPVLNMPVPPVGESILGVPIVRILTSLELTERAFTEVDGKTNALLKQRQTIEDQLAKLNTFSDTLGRARDRLEKSDPNRSVNDIQQYLRRSANVRAEKVKRARGFLEAGTSAKAVREELDPRSKLDQAMAGRKPAPGSQRPPARPPAQ